MSSEAKITDHKGIKACELTYNGYYCLVAPTIGSSVLRFRDNDKDIEVFRYYDDVSISEVINAPEVWGLPTLYLPNRFDRGWLRTSDNLYHLPINESMFNNHIHGFIQKRAYKIKEMGSDENKAFIKSSFTYDENDYFFNCYPVKFTVEITVELSADGLKHTVSLLNESDKMMPISIATHTAYNAPFVSDSKQEDVRLQVPCAEKIIFDKSRWLPTGEKAALDAWDIEYTDGVKVPVLQDICNDMYSAGTVKLDGEDFYGVVVTDLKSGYRICNEVDEKYKFWVIWNDEGFKDYFCVEPMTAQINAPNLDMAREESGYSEIAPNEVYEVSQRFFTK